MSIVKPQPYDAGTSTNLPPDIRDRANVRSEVVAWTKLDPEHEEELGKYICMRTFGMFVMPCFWPHLIICWPFLWMNKVAAQNSAKSQWWILTENELRILTTDHDQSCIPGCCLTGDVVKTIPLENITDCGTDARGGGSMNNCAGDLPIIYVDTASTGGKGHEVWGLALKDYEWFVRQVMDRKDIVRGRGNGGGRADLYDAPIAHVVDDRGGKTAEERIAEAKNLKDKGIISEEEFQEKRKQIIASM